MQQLVDLYQALKQLEGADVLESDCEELCNHLLRFAHEHDPRAYLDCVTWEIDQSVPP